MSAESQALLTWIATLTQLLYRATGVKPAIRQTGAGVAENPSGAIWWRCDVAGTTGPIFIGAAEPAWQALAGLLGSGMPAGEGSARESYLKFLDETFDATGTAVDRELPSKRCEIVEIRMPESAPFRLQFFTEPKLAQANSALDLLLDIELPITIRFGMTQMLLQDLLAVQPNSTIEFDRRVNDPVEILVNGRMAARGEAVIVRGNYGIRITEIADRQDRLETSAAFTR